MSVNFDAIPSELKRYDAWVLWRAIVREGGKLTKIPLNPHTAQAASSTDPSHWGSFEQCKAIYEQYPGEVAGIGFVLSQYDPFVFVDLDNFDKCSDPAYAKDVQTKVFERIPGYTEFSPSGTGLHIIGRSSMLPSGAKWSKAGVEIYTENRFMTMTGNVFRDLPLTDYTAQVHSLWAKIKEDQNGSFEYQGDSEQTKEDQQILDIASTAANGEKFQALHSGNWQQYYSSQSEADIAYWNIIAFYSRNHEQTKRIFKNCALYREDKYGRREAFLDTQIQRAFDRLPPPMDFGEIKMKLALALENEIEATPEDAASTVEPGKALAAPRVSISYDTAVKTFPPGLVGRVAQFVYDQSPSPIREISLVAAIGFVAGIVGRGWNVSGTGLNQYLLMLAVTGAGKEAVHSGLSKLFTAAKGDGIGNGFASAMNFSGPADLASGRGLLSILSEQPSCVSVIGEFGIRLKNMSLVNASSSERDLKRVIMDAYAKSGAGGSINPTAYADKTKNQDPIPSPAFSFIGESTPERFYECLDENMVEDGLMPRFTIVEYKGEIPPFNKQAANAKPSADLIEEIRTLMFFAHDRGKRMDICKVQMNEPAQKLFEYFMEFRRSMLNDKSNSSASRHMWNRAPLKAMKLAATVAVGVNPIMPVIDMDIAEWAVAIALGDAHNIIRRFDTGLVGEHLMNGGEQKQFDDLRNLVGRWLRDDGDKKLPKDINIEWLQNGIIQYSPILNTLRGYASYRKDRLGQTAALKRTLQFMVDAGMLYKVPPNKLIELKTNQVLYAVINPEQFLSG